MFHPLSHCVLRTILWKLRDKTPQILRVRLNHFEETNKCPWNSRYREARSRQLKEQRKPKLWHYIRLKDIPTESQKAKTASIPECDKKLKGRTTHLLVRVWEILHSEQSLHEFWIPAISRQYVLPAWSFRYARKICGVYITKFPQNRSQNVMQYWMKHPHQIDE